MTPDMLHDLTRWALLVMGTAFVSLLVWTAVRVVNQVERLRDLFVAESKMIEMRFTRLETLMGSAKPGTHLSGMD